MPAKIGRPRTGVTVAMVEQDLNEFKLTVSQIAAKHGVSRDTIERRARQSSLQVNRGVQEGATKAASAPKKATPIQTPKPSV